MDEVRAARDRFLDGYRGLVSERWPSRPVRDAEVREVPEEIAARLHRWAHYLGSPRDGLLHLGLYEPGAPRGAVPWALATVSDFDLAHLTAELPGLRAGRVAVVSRLVAFEWSPENALSYVLGRVADVLRQGQLEAVVSYVDPNLGFDGAVYRAVGGRVVARERKRRYLFLDGAYVTDRVIVEQYGTVERAAHTLGDRLEASVRPLEPLELYGWPLAGEVPGSQDRLRLVFPSASLVGGSLVSR